jgi:hypothetical protein
MVMWQVEWLLDYWAENPPTHVIAKSFVKIRKRVGLPSKPGADDTTGADLAKMMKSGMIGVRGKPKNG